MKSLRAARLTWFAPFLTAALICAASSKNPVAHVDVKTVQSYQGPSLPKPDRVVVYDFVVDHDRVQTDKMPGIRQRIKNSGSSGDAATVAGEQVQQQITQDMVKQLQKSLKASGIVVEKGTPEMRIADNTLVVRGTITQLDQGHRLRRGTIGLGAGASDVKTDCEISMHAAAKTVLVSELTTEAKSGKKPGAAVTMGAGTAPEVAAGATGVTAHRSTAQGDAARTGSALAKHLAEWMKTQGWIAKPEPAAAATEAKH